MPDRKSVPTKRPEAQPEDVVWSAADATSLLAALSNTEYSIKHRVRYAIRKHPTLFADLNASARMLLWELGELRFSKQNQKKECFTAGHRVLAAATGIPLRSISGLLNCLAKSAFPFIQYTRGKRGKNSEFSLIEEPLSYAASLGRITVEVNWEDEPVPLKEWLAAQRQTSGATSGAKSGTPLGTPLAGSGATSGATPLKAQPTPFQPKRERRQHVPYRPFPSKSRESHAASESPDIEAYHLIDKFGCPKTGRHDPNGCINAAKCRMLMAIELAQSEQRQVAV